MINLTDHQVGTYAKILLQDWPVARDMITTKCALAKELVQETSEDDNPALKELLADRQINDALNGPFQTFFKLHLAGFATIAHLTMALTISKGEILKSKDFIGEIDYGISEEVLSKNDFSELKQTQQSLSTMMQENMAHLESQIEDWNSLLLATLNENNFPLNDIEIQDFCRNETISELSDRFIDIKIELPKLKKADFNFRQYYTLKLTLMIHSALSRMHQSNTDKDIHKVLNHCQKQLKDILSQEKEIYAGMKEKIDTLINPLLG